MGRRGWLFATVGWLLGLAAGFAAWGTRLQASGAPVSSPAVELTPVQAPVAGAIAPEFETNGVDGESFRMHEARGRSVVLSFWATWCEPCRDEMRLLEACFGGEDASGVLVLGVNSGEALSQVLAYRDALGLTFPLLLDPGGKIQSLYRVHGYPTTFFVDETGRIQHVHVGSLDAETLDGYLRATGRN